MYKSIIVPLDGSDLAERVLPYASCIAKGYQSSLELVRSIPPVPDLPADIARADTPRVLRDAIRTRAQDYLEKVSQGLQSQGLDASYRVLEGDTASGIIDVKDDTADSIIIMGTHGWSGIDRWNLGSITLKVLQATNKPVMVVPGMEQDDSPVASELSTVFVTLDGSTLSETALPHATALANKLNLKLVLLRVAPTSWEYYPNLDHTVLHYGDMSRDIAERADSYLSGVAQRLETQGVSQCEHRVLRGHPAGEIIDLADETPGSIVVMASHGQGSSVTFRWSMGSVAQRVSGGCRRPILVVGRK